MSRTRTTALWLLGVSLALTVTAIILGWVVFRSPYFYPSAALFGVASGEALMWAITAEGGSRLRS